MRNGTEAVNVLKSPSVIFLGIDEEKSRNAMRSPCLELSSSDSFRAKLFAPISLIVGQELAKRALIVLAVNPSIGGLAISGGRGTAKSTLAKALHRLMPDIIKVNGSLYNDDPGDYSNTSVVETVRIPCPFVQVPLNALPDRLFGALDAKQTMESNSPVFAPGLLAESHRGVLCVDDINQLEPDILTTMLQFVSEGIVRLERDGFSQQYNCKTVLIATYNREDAEFHPSYQDQIGISVDTDREQLSAAQRLDAAQRVRGVMYSCAMCFLVRFFNKY